MRDIGELWEELSGGRCLFVMATDKDWKVILEKMGKWHQSRDGVSERGEIPGLAAIANFVNLVSHTHLGEGVSGEWDLPGRGVGRMGT